MCSAAHVMAASSASDTWSRGVLSGNGVCTVQPVHGVIVIGADTIPPRQTQSKHCSPRQRLPHGCQSALGIETVGVVEHLLLLGAICFGDGVDRVNSRDIYNTVLDDLAVLYVQTTNLGERAGGSVVGSEELGDDSECGCSVDCHLRAIECVVAISIRIEIATIHITNFTTRTRTFGLAYDGAGVSDIGR